MQVLTNDAAARGIASAFSRARATAERRRSVRCRVRLHGACRNWWTYWEDEAYSPTLRWCRCLCHRRTPGGPQ